MTERPDKVIIRCERCKSEQSLSAIHRSDGACSNCGHDSWEIQATYLARQETADGTTLALNAIGLNIFSSTGLTLGGPLPVEKKPVNGFDIHEVSAQTMREIADPQVDPAVKLDAFIRLKRNELYQKHRERMEQHGQQCDQCGILFVLNDKKPWTLVGTCSKVCCANKFGAADYALIEHDVIQQASQVAPEVLQRQRDNMLIHVQCPDCGHQFNLATMYSGVYRKCPACHAKVLVPAS